MFMQCTLPMIITFKEDANHVIDYDDHDSAIDEAREDRTIEDRGRYENNFNK